MAELSGSELKSDLIQLLVACGIGGLAMVMILVLVNSAEVTVEQPYGLGVVFLYGAIVGLLVAVVLKSMKSG